MDLKIVKYCSSVLNLLTSLFIDKPLFIISFSVVLSLSIQTEINGQTLNKKDSTLSEKPALTVGGYIDFYYAYNFNKPPSKDQPYFVSMARHNEFNVNLAFLDVNFHSPRVRGRIVPGFGTYMNSNYASESNTFKQIVEASAGVKVSPKRNIWIDAGIFASPFTNENAISKDQLTYTRSFAPEYVPYYLAGLKLMIPFSKKINGHLYLINGWQQITDQNNSPAIATQLEYRIKDNLLANWNTYIGKERSAIDTLVAPRYFTDFYVVYTGEAFSFTSCVYAGLQQQSRDQNAVWWQANVIGRYAITQALSVSGRVEYFDDQKNVHVVPITGTNGFNTFGTSVGLNFRLTEKAIVRFEARHLFSEKKVYERSGSRVNNSTVLTSNLTVWF